MVLSMRARAVSPLLAIACFLVASLTACGFAAAALLTGRVLDARTGEPITDARVRIFAPAKETVTDRAGEFRFGDLAPGAYEMEASRVGYQPERRASTVDSAAAAVEFRLEARAIPVAPVEVTTTRASERGSAVAFTDLDPKELEKRYWAQDVPMLLAETTGVHAYSDAGSGIGYSYVKIRGIPLMVTATRRVTKSTGWIIPISSRARSHSKSSE